MNKFKRFPSKSLLHKINISHKIADHLVGENHTPTHQKMIGVGIMFIGVMIAKGSALISFTFVHIFGDVLGYFMHGLGAVPFVKNMEILGERRKEIKELVKIDEENEQIKTEEDGQQ